MENRGLNKPGRKEKIGMKGGYYEIGIRKNHSNKKNKMGGEREMGGFFFEKKKYKEEKIKEDVDLCVWSLAGGTDK